MVAVRQPAMIRLTNIRAKQLIQGIVPVRRFQRANDLFNTLTRQTPGLHAHRVAYDPR